MMRIVGKLAWIFVILCLALAIVIGVPNDMSSWTDWAKEHLESFGKWITDWLKTVDIGQYFTWNPTEDLNSTAKSLADTAESAKSK